MLDGELPEASLAILQELRQKREAELMLRRDSEWLKNNPPTPDNLQSASWWTLAREKVAGLDPQEEGGTYCGYWTSAMYDAIAAYANAHPETDLAMEKKYSQVREHYWLELESKSFDSFVADGTAGQLHQGNPAYLQGAYESKAALIAKLSKTNEHVAHMYQNSPTIETFRTKNRIKPKSLLHTAVHMLKKATFLRGLGA